MLASHKKLGKADLFVRGFCFRVMDMGATRCFVQEALHFLTSFYKNH